MTVPPFPRAFTGNVSEKLANPFSNSKPRKASFPSEEVAQPETEFRFVKSLSGVEGVCHLWAMEGTLL